MVLILIFDVKFVKFNERQKLMKRKWMWWKIFQVNENKVLSSETVLDSRLTTRTKWGLANGLAEGALCAPSGKPWFARPSGLAIFPCPIQLHLLPSLQVKLNLILLLLLWKKLKSVSYFICYCSLSPTFFISQFYHSLIPTHFKKNVIILFNFLFSLIFNLFSFLIFAFSLTRFCWMNIVDFKTN